MKVLLDSITTEPGTTIWSSSEIIRGDNGDANEKVAEKETSRPLNLFRPFAN